MAICPIICSFYYLARALMHDVAGEIACAEGCAETISANVLKRSRVFTHSLMSIDKFFGVWEFLFLNEMDFFPYFLHQLL